MTAVAISIPSQVLPSLTSPDKTDRGFCSRVAHGTLDRLKRFGIGVASTSVLIPIAGAPIYLASKIGLIEDFTNRGKNLAEAISNLRNQFGIPFDEKRILSATCPLQEMADQMNQTMPGLQMDPIYFKMGGIGYGVIAAPIMEEVIFRGLIQDVLLKRLPKWVMKKVAPGKETVLDSRIAKIARVVLTAALFSAVHLSNQGFFPDAYVKAQVIGAFVLGLGLGAIKESKVGLLGSIGAHMANNMLALSGLLTAC